MEKTTLEQQEKLKARMSRVKHKIPVISGKGGVGKSTITLNLAVAFATFAGRFGMPIIGIIENMSGFVCPNC